MDYTKDNLPVNSSVEETGFNYIYIFRPIDENVALDVVQRIFAYEAKMIKDGIPTEERVITLVLNSPGGSVSDGRAIYDTMGFCSCKIQTICVGMAASMAAFLLSSGTRGMRRATKNSEILIHQPLAGVREGQASDLIIAADHIKRTRDWLNCTLAANTGKSIEEISRDTDRDYILTAEAALEYGLIDEVIDVPNKAFNREVMVYGN